jgi:hypothetical protein
LFFGSLSFYQRESNVALFTFLHNFTDSTPMNKLSYNALKGLGATVALLAG